MTLEQYFKENYDRHAIDHALRANVDSAGNVVFYIHAQGRDSNTLDFEVRGNELTPRLMTVLAQPLPPTFTFCSGL